VKAIAPLLVLALLASCAAPQKPAPQPPAPVTSAPPPAPAPAPLPPPPADWRDAAQTPGSWRWSAGDPDNASVASFGTSRTDPVVMLVCDRLNKRVRLHRATDPLRPAPATPLQVVTTNMSRPMLSDPTLSTGGWLVVSLPVNDPLLDAIAFSRGRFALEAAERATLYLPSSPELSRVIEDCR